MAVDFIVLISFSNLAGDIVQSNCAQKELKVEKFGVIVFSGLFYVFWGVEYESEVFQQKFHRQI